MAHNINDSGLIRTTDVKVSEKIHFSSLLLSERVQEGLQAARFERPSPIQLKAIPVGRCGLDLIVQAKSGTGKTCVFAVVALESLVLENLVTQVLVLAPTREIAVQIQNVINLIGGRMTGLECQVFIGGLKVKQDKIKLMKCHIAVGSPGRIKQLIESKLLKTDHVRLFVLDEADKLVESEFQQQINWIYSALPQNKQMLALSATYPEALAEHLTKYMRNPTFVRLNSDDPALLGISQYYDIVDKCEHTHDTVKLKVQALIQLLSNVTFNQCIIFFNHQLMADEIAETLNDRGWPATTIAGSHSQTERLNAMAKLKTFQCRVLITTDLTARGIDAEHVNLIVNLDVPRDPETYFHRIGRAGRYGTYGAAVTYVATGTEEIQLYRIKTTRKLSMSVLPDPLPENLLQINKIQFGNVDSLVRVTRGARPSTDPGTDTSEITPARTRQVSEKSEKLSREIDADKELYEMGLREDIPSLNVYKTQGKKGCTQTYRQILEGFRLFIAESPGPTRAKNCVGFGNDPLPPSYTNNGSSLCRDRIGDHESAGGDNPDSNETVPGVLPPHRDVAGIGYFLRNIRDNSSVEIKDSAIADEDRVVAGSGDGGPAAMSRDTVSEGEPVPEGPAPVPASRHGIVPNSSTIRDRGSDGSEDSVTDSSSGEESAENISDSSKRPDKFKKAQTNWNSPRPRSAEYSYRTHFYPDRCYCNECTSLYSSTYQPMYCGEATSTLDMLVCPCCRYWERAIRTIHLQPCNLCYYREYIPHTYPHSSVPTNSGASLPKYLRDFRAYINNNNM